MTASEPGPVGSGPGAGAAAASVPAGIAQSADAEERREAERWLRSQLLQAVEGAWWPQPASAEAVEPFRQGLHRISFRLRFGRDALGLEDVCDELRVLASETGAKKWQVECYIGYLIAELVQCLVPQCAGLVFHGFLLPIVREDGADQ